MSEVHVLLVAGTHGNEINAPWLFDQWTKQPDIISNYGLKISKAIGNPKALKDCKRYLDSDLNRSFRSELLNDNGRVDCEICRARELLSSYGSKGTNPCQIAIDFHSTTSSMGSSLVVYGRRPADLAIVALLQAKLGLPVYLHEGDKTQQGFLVESWPCGVVIEIGPVPQGVLLASIIQQTRLVLETCLYELSRVGKGLVSFPSSLIVHRHLRSIDFPRSKDRQIEAFIHPLRQGKDWVPIQSGSPLFMKLDSNIVKFEGDEELVPVFINEAAYIEKNIAMSFTKRETWKFLSEWEYELRNLFYEPH